MKTNFRRLLALALISGVSCFCPRAEGAAQDCAGCHAKESARFLTTPMGESLVPPQRLPSAKITHEMSHSELTIKYPAGGMVHTLSENGFTAERRVRYQVGGGLMGSSFLVQVGDYLFESPASWFKTYGWDVSPGYASAPLIDFDCTM